MIQNKTEYFLKIRQKPTKSYACISIHPILNQLVALGSCILQLENKMEMSTLPNFGSKEKKYREINDLKGRVQTLVKEIEQNVKSFNCEEKNIVESVQQYLLNNLRIYLAKFRNFEQKSLCKSDKTIQNFNIAQSSNHSFDYLEALNPETIILQETIQRSNNIKTSIFNVTNTLIQLKMALKSQTCLIDTIDSCFDKSNMYLEQANKEIEKIPGNYCGFKDYVIYTLLYIICILLVLLFIKIYKNKIPWVENPQIIFKQKWPKSSSVRHFDTSKN
ncbi:uncharacterized protein VICG_00592 [Vittaforma corneae ATCC 50505]|uniref:t-SNARE coiled-coil homology domain-containing protein n=1 Tax=Vittaforma corneae (strain ATCC 50505) TaxID=993615 RepID=L2GNM1_VITCO|nr:uncharacterized protein VICG_00592 [Vittaforma corneae ATCC 50505]ELA42493.1 hypothetical protein VICG_00592 [Vittaforma corneae ATCC 50505]